MESRGSRRGRRPQVHVVLDYGRSLGTGVRHTPTAVLSEGRMGDE